MSSVIYFLGQELTRERRHTAEQYRQAALTKYQQIAVANALRICQQIQAENQGSWWARRRCARCVKNGVDGIPARVLDERIGYCICPAINRRYRAQLADH